MLMWRKAQIIAPFDSDPEFWTKAKIDAPTEVHSVSGTEKLGVPGRRKW
jgi:hypothetical protein